VEPKSHNYELLCRQCIFTGDVPSTAVDNFMCYTSQRCDAPTP